MFIRLLRCPKPHVLFVDMPTQMKMGFVTKQNQAKITGLFSILSLIVWQNSLLSSSLASVCFWRICTLYGSIFKSLWMVLCSVILEMPTSWGSRCVDFCGDCSRCFLSAWTLGPVLAVTYCPLWPLLSFPTLPMFLNFLTIFVIVFLHGAFLAGNSLQNSLWLRTTDFVGK